LPNRWTEPRNLDVLLTGGYKTGTVERYWFGPDAKTPAFSYLKGDITEAYSAKVRQVKRSFAFINCGGGSVPAALVVFDRVVSSDPSFKKYWLLHSMEQPAIDGNTTVLSLSQRGWSGKLINTTLLPEADNAEIVTVGGPGKEFWVFGKNWKNEIPPGRENNYEVGAWRMELSPKAPAATDLFLNVMQLADRGTNATLPVEKIEDRDLIGVRLADRVVVFSRTAECVNHALSLTVPGSGSLKYLVTDLSEGVWQVWLDGRIVHPAALVTGSSGVLYFEGPAGRYELRR